MFIDFLYYYFYQIPFFSHLFIVYQDYTANRKVTTFPGAINQTVNKEVDDKKEKKFSHIKFVT